MAKLKWTKNMLGHKNLLQVLQPSYFFVDLKVPKADSQEK